MELDKTKTGIVYMLEAHKIGGPYMYVITLLGIIMLGIVIWKIVDLVSRKAVSLNYLDLILMAGSVAAAVGIFSQIVGIVQALEAIRAAGDISPSLIMSGAIISFYAPAWGFFVFIVSTLFYFILKEIIKAKRP